MEHKQAMDLPRVTPTARNVRAEVTHPDSAGGGGGAPGSGQQESMLWGGGGGRVVGTWKNVNLGGLSKGGNQLLEEKPVCKTTA